MDPKADDPKAGADVGKIVNLMAGDANRISHIVSGAYFIYGGKFLVIIVISDLSHKESGTAPFEIIIATVFLYQ